MTDVKLFKIVGLQVSELDGTAVALEKSLQTLFERNLESLLGVRFVASELATSNGGRMDTLGIDENNCPVIIEYKRDKNENVINQGLFYLDWLMDHRRDFEWKVMKLFDEKVATAVAWEFPRLICIAGDFTKYDVHAVNQMNRNIELIRYRRFGDDLLLLELLTATSSSDQSETKSLIEKKPGGSGTKYKTITQYIEDADERLRALYDALRDHVLAISDDVQEHTLKNYIAFRRIKNFACVEVKPQIAELHVFVKVDPDSVQLEEGFTRDVRSIGHFGTGELEITISNEQELEKAKALIWQSYDNS